MKVIEPHIHMIARTTQDYERMARMHTVACCEPAFWAGYVYTVQLQPCTISAVYFLCQQIQCSGQLLCYTVRIIQDSDTGAFFSWEGLFKK